MLRVAGIFDPCNGEDLPIPLVKVTVVLHVTHSA